MHAFPSDPLLLLQQAERRFHAMTHLFADLVARSFLLQAVSQKVTDMLIQHVLSGAPLASNPRSVSPTRLAASTPDPQQQVLLFGSPLEPRTSSPELKADTPSLHTPAFFVLSSEGGNPDEGQLDAAQRCAIAPFATPIGAGARAGARAGVGAR